MLSVEDKYSQPSMTQASAGSCLTAHGETTPSNAKPAMLVLLPWRKEPAHARGFLAMMGSHVLIISVFQSLTLASLQSVPQPDALLPARVLPSMAVRIPLLRLTGLHSVRGRSWARGWTSPSTVRLASTLPSWESWRGPAPVTTSCALVIKFVWKAAVSVRLPPAASISNVGKAQAALTVSVWK